MIAIDTNTWIYYMGKGLREHKTVKNLVDGVLKKEAVLINTVVAMEVAHALTRAFDTDKAREKINVFLSYPMLVDEFDNVLLGNALDLFLQHKSRGVGVRDATLLASMRRHGVNTLITHDEAFKKVSDIKVIDPIE